VAPTHPSQYVPGSRRVCEKGSSRQKGSGAEMKKEVAEEKAGAALLQYAKYGTGSST